MKIRPLIFLFLVTASLQAADEPNPVETKLREGLRNTLLQLRDAQSQIATLQAAQQDSDLKNKDLTAKVESQAKQMSDDKAVADKTIADLNAKVTEQQGELARISASLEKWKQGYKQAVDLLHATEAKRAELAEQKIKLDRQVADQQTKNDAMFKLGNEILTRYEKFGLGDALTAREPFVGITRVKFENLIQNYSDGLADQKIKP